MSVSVLPSGSMLIDHAQLFWNLEPGKSIRHPVFAVLIEHPAGLVLVDTGFDLDHVAAQVGFVEPIAGEGESVAAGLAGRKLGFDRIDLLVHTHLHFDHVGADRMFGEGTTMLVHKEEMRHARTPETFETISYSDRRHSEAAYKVELLEGDQEILPGIILLETPGHSAGHYSVLLRGESGRDLLLCGDASYSPGNLEQMLISGFHLDAVESVRSLERLRRIAAAESVTPWFPHDMESFRSYPASPASLPI